MSYDYTALAQEQPLLKLIPKLIPFTGGEREDFRHFKQMLETYLELTNTTSDTRKLAILRTQVHKSAKTYLDCLKDQYKDSLTFDIVMTAFETKFVTAELLESYKLMLNEMKQGTEEHPRDFYSRLQEVARLAKKEDDDIILMRFRYGLNPNISKHCIALASITAEQWLKNAEAWWSANKSMNYGMINNRTTEHEQLLYPGYAMDRNTIDNPHNNINSFNVMEFSKNESVTNLSSNSDPIVKLLERLVLNVETMEKKVNDKIEQIQHTKKQTKNNDNMSSDDIIKLVRSELAKSNGPVNNSNNNNYNRHNNQYNNKRFYRQQQKNQDYHNNNYYNDKQPPQPQQYNDYYNSAQNLSNSQQVPIQQYQQHQSHQQYNQQYDNQQSKN